MKKTLLIFDIDGTLVYSNKVDSRCFAETYQQLFGKEFPSINWMDYPHVTDTTIFGSVFRNQFGREVEPAVLDHFKRRFVQRLQEARRDDPLNFQEVPGAVSTLDRLSQDPRFSVGVATGGFELPARYKLGYLGIDTTGFHMSFADEKTTREAIIQESLTQAERQEGPFERVVYLGDAIWDVRTTRNLSMNFIGIRRKGDVQLLTREGAAHVLQDFRDFDLLLDTVYQAEPPGQAKGAPPKNIFL
jgi:phosphoglycolate phosphatase-like HAD superfamily hydrolase